MKVRNMLVKVSIVFLFSILIWRVIFYFNDLYSIGGYSSMIHFFTALRIAILSFVLIEIMRRIDKVSWKQIGMSNIRTNISSFLVGTILWLIPAFIGLVISLLAGWVEITVLSNIGFHVSIMTASQILNPVHGNFDVNGVFAIRFFAFSLLPYVLGSFALEYIYPNHSWSEIIPFKKYPRYSDEK